jgi:4-hydroxybenzoate polyprenyltransferase
MLSFLHFVQSLISFLRMQLSTTTDRALIRTLLVLGRVSNLPTVWSNCLAGWLLGGGGSWWSFVLLCVGATCLYVGGMYLNDAFDVEFDREFRRDRPIPSGAISLEAVWRWSFLWMVIGMAVLITLGSSTIILALLLGGAIVLYDAVHKLVTFSPVLMAACRFLLFLVAATAGTEGINGLVIWSGLALACYIVGLSYVARFESVPGALRYWPLVFLAAPLVLAQFSNAGSHRLPSLVLTAGLAIWIALCLQHAFWAPHRNVTRTVSGLLAGICLVDWLAVGSGPILVMSVFPVLLLAALLFQRFVPAT